MQRDEFKTWHDDLARRLPETAAYIAGLPQESRDMWFAEIFESHELRDALALNAKMFASGEGTAKYARDELPSLFCRMLRDQRYDRENRAESAKRQSRERKRRGRATGVASVDVTATVRSDPVMTRMLEYVQDRIREYRQETAQQPPGELLSRWADQSSKKFDTLPDDEYGRFKCHRCLDHSVVTFQRDGATYVGACPHCDAGRARAGRQYTNSKASLGFAPGPADASQFQDALESESAH